MKGVAFDSWRSVGLAAQSARVHSMRGVDELVILDIGATDENRGPDLGLIAELSETCFMPLSVGGGVRSVDDVRSLLRAGADKVVVCSAALDRPALISEIADAVGRQALVISIDVRGGWVTGRCGKHLTQCLPVEWAMRCEQLGAGELIVSSVDRDGEMSGYDLDLIADIARTVGIPVVASGGCSGYADMLAAIRAGASGVAAGALFQFTDATPKEAARYLHNHGVEARL